MYHITNVIVDISKAKFLCKDPDDRFCKEYLLPLGTWKELWRRYKLLDYSNGDLRDYLFIKHGRNLSYNAMDRWIVRSEIYMLSKPVLDKGANMVNSEIFGDYEQFVMDELTKNVRFSGSTKSRAII